MHENQAANVVCGVALYNSKYNVVLVDTWNILPTKCANDVILLPSRSFEYKDVILLSSQSFEDKPNFQENEVYQF